MFNKIRKIKFFLTIILSLFFFARVNILSQENKLLLTKGPYLQNVTKNSIIIMWETNIESDSGVDYGLTKDYGMSISDSTPVKIHEIKLQNLSEETLYYYKVVSNGQSSEQYTFRTAIKRDTPFRFSVWGDNRTDYFTHTKVIRAMIKKKPDLAISVGDVVTNGDVYEQWSTEYFLPIRELAKSTPTFIAIGNHERNADWFYKFVSQPGNESYFAFTYGNSRFIIFDSNKSYQPGSEQLLWLKKELKSDEYKNATWHFIFMHHPLYSEGWDSPGYSGEILARMILQPLLEKYKMDIVFAGHTHDYERGELNGIYYIITGGGGASLDTFQQDFLHITVYKSTYQFCTVDVKGKELVFNSYDIYGKSIDTFSVKKN